jgi:1-acyl-sn-glycerol-3-phosphate acyltransferase
MRQSQAKHGGPKAKLWTYYVGRAYLRAIGWTTEGELPTDPKAVLIAAPHTSNWDLAHMLAVAWVFRLRLRWLGKHTIFKGAAGPVMRWLGGIPVDRRSPHGVVQQVVDHFADTDTIVLAIAPPGTRKRTKNWKSGFYHIAAQAQVPILCGFLDFGRRVGGVGPAIMPSGDVQRDMDRIREFYAGMEGKFPDFQAEILLKDEQSEPTSGPRQVAEPLVAGPPATEAQPLAESA